MSDTTDQSAPAARTTPAAGDEYPFHTITTEDGETVCGIAFHMRRGQFYEFLRPEPHDKYAKYRDPRTGETITHDTVINHAVAEVQGFIRERVNAAEWAEFRQLLLETEEEDFETWVEHWERVAGGGDAP